MRRTPKTYSVTYIVSIVCSLTAFAVNSTTDGLGALPLAEALQSDREPCLDSYPQGVVNSFHDLKKHYPDSASHELLRFSIANPTSKFFRKRFPARDAYHSYRQWRQSFPESYDCSPDEFFARAPESFPEKWFLSGGNDKSGYPVFHLLGAAYNVDIKDNDHYPKYRS